MRPKSYFGEPRCDNYYSHWSRRQDPAELRRQANLNLMGLRLRQTIKVR